MTRPHRRVPARRLNWFLAAMFCIGVFSACEPTPGYLQRWPNTPESEERFKGYLLDSDLTHEVRVKALELLIEQWDYSASMLFNGGTLDEIADTATRDAILRLSLIHI